MAPNCFAYICDNAIWGTHIDMVVNNNTNADAYLNVLMDWNQDGMWQGSSICPFGAPAEHVLADFVIPPAYSGPVTLLGANPGTSPGPGFVTTMS